MLSYPFYLAQRIGSVSFVHCPGEASMVAHFSARKSFDSQAVISWDDEPLDFLLADLVKDVTII